MYDVLNEIYDMYKAKLEEATSMWKSEYSGSISEDEDRDKSDKEDLIYFKELLQKINSALEKK